MPTPGLTKKRADELEYKLLHGSKLEIEDCRDLIEFMRAYLGLIESNRRFIENGWKER